MGVSAEYVKGQRVCLRGEHLFSGCMSSVLQSASVFAALPVPASVNWLRNTIVSPAVFEVELGSELETGDPDPEAPGPRSQVCLELACDSGNRLPAQLPPLK